MASRQLPPLSMVRAFEAAARHLSFSHAADELRVTHSAVSHQIRGLEDWLAEPLFVRSARKVHLTPAGEVLAQPLTRALDTIAEAVAAARALSAEENKGPVLVSVEPAFAARWLFMPLTLRSSCIWSRHLTLLSSKRVALTLRSAMDGLIGQVSFQKNSWVPPLSQL